MPAKAYLEMLLEHVEEGDSRPESLSEVASAERDSGDVPTTVRANADGTLRIHKARVQGSPPRNPEELRSRYRLMAAAWQCVALRQPHHPGFQRFHEGIFMSLLDHLLGPELYLYRVSLPDGTTYGCPWDILLAYEYQVRRRAFQLMESKALSLATALMEAIQCPDTRRRHFDTPVAMAAGAAMAAQASVSTGVKRTHPASSSTAASGSKGSSGKGASKSANSGKSGRFKAKAKGKAKAVRGERRDAPCFRFLKGKCTLGDECLFTHRCPKCGSESQPCGCSK